MSETLEEVMVAEDVARLEFKVCEAAIAWRNDDNQHGRLTSIQSSPNGALQHAIDELIAAREKINARK